ncbi:MAG: hypothetical protein DRJ09_00310 [Bacteroidetes bacterium]|nr:MAG: hypothetical protein DRJ09_00310 [Bacteroidota bacterium]
MKNDIILQVNGLSKSIKGMPVLSDFNMEIFEGDICGIIGPNDSGKTMLLRALTALINPDKGKIEIFGKKLIPNRAAILSNVGALIGDPVFYNHLTLFDNLLLFSKYSGLEKDNDEIHRVLKLTSLYDLSDEKVDKLASGDRKKLAIAMAIYNNPPLILLDEPFSSLDIKSLAEMKSLLKSINRNQGTTILVATKRLTELQGFINRIVLMEGGRLISEGNVDELFGRSNVGLVIETDNPAKAMKLIKESDLPIASVVIEDDHVRVSCEKKVIPFINEYLMVSEVQVFMLRPDDAIISYYLTFTE